MKLRIKGKVDNVGRHADFTHTYDHLPSFIGKRVSLPLNDLYLEVEEVYDDCLLFSIFYFDRAHEYSLRLGEGKSLRQEGNAFLLELEFYLEK
ncbi:MAG: hypothetical protein K6B65_03425 [Bacilli bacterium]|nr:hypothetical protein [Bacilli bacterium]